MRDCGKCETRDLIHTIAGSRGNLSVLLWLYTKSNQRAMKTAVANVLRQTLSTTAAFQHDPDEVDLWLRSLPITKRAPGATAPDGTSLTDEGEAVIGLLDDCLQRCMKTPYRYLEELQTLCTDDSTSDVDTPRSYDPSLLPSPMLVTVLEQVQAKINGDLLSPSDALAVVAFVRKLLVSFATKVPTLHILDAASERLKSLVYKPEHLGDSITAGINCELRVLAMSVQQLASPNISEPEEDNDAVDGILGVDEEPVGQLQASSVRFMSLRVTLVSCHRYPRAKGAGCV